MNFDFSEDQRRLQEELARVLADRSTSANVRKVLEGDAPYCPETWRELAGVGALGLAIDEDHGGAGMGLLELCLVAEEAGRALAAVPLASSIYLAAEAIRRSGNAAVQAEWLPRLAGGDAIATAQLARHGQHVLPVDPPTLGANGLSGTWNAMLDVMVADVAVLLVGDALVVLDLSAQGVSRKVQQSLDPTRPLGQLACQDTAATILLESGGAALAQQVVAGAAVLLAFEQIGGAEAALYAARDYALERKTFGRVIGGYQAVKHKLADIYVAIEVARAHAYYGAWALSAGAAELPRAAAAARVAATQAYRLAAEESLHLHGGIGYTWEMDCHLHLRRERWLGQIIGNVHYWREQLAACLIEEAA